MLVRTDSGTLTLTFDGRPIAARDGDSVASALLAAGIRSTRLTALSGSPRGPYCLMGACFECLAVVDGVPNVQTCLPPDFPTNVSSLPIETNPPRWLGIFGSRWVEE